MWLLRSTHQSLRARHARRACSGGDHLGACELGHLGEFAHPEADQIRDEEKEPTAGGVEGARGEGELADVGDGLDVGSAA